MSMRRSCYLPYSGEESKHNKHCNIDRSSLQGSGQQHNDTRLVHDVSDEPLFRIIMVCSPQLQPTYVQAYPKWIQA